MPAKKFFGLVTLFLTVYGTLSAISEKNYDVITLNLQFKIPAISEKQNFYILPKDKLKYTYTDDILVLSRKYCNIYRFDSKGQFTGSFLRKGEGPQELSYPQYIFPLSNSHILVLNADKFIFYEMKKDQIVEVERTAVSYSDIGDIEEYNQEKLFILTAFPLAQGLKGSDAGKLIHIYDLKNKKNILDYFETQGETRQRYSNELRSEYGSGDIYYTDNLIFLVFNQPGDLYIFNPDGILFKKISTRFPFVKNNTAEVKQIDQDGNIVIRMNYAKTCQMNLFMKNKKIYLVTRINYGKDEDPVYRFYFSLLDYKEGKFINHLKVETGGINVSNSEFKCFNEQNLIFLDEDFIYSFSMD